MLGFVGEGSLFNRMGGLTDAENEIPKHFSPFGIVVGDEFITTIFYFFTFSSSFNIISSYSNKKKTYMNGN